MEMKCIKIASFFISILVVFLSSTTTSCDEFVECMVSSNLTSSNIFLTRNDTSFTTVLQSNIPNLRFSTPTTIKPLAIITPLSYSDVQSTVICSVQSGVQIRIRSGGHDFEGLSYTSLSSNNFIVLDLNKLRSVTVDPDDRTAWVESGATLGELYYWVSQKSNVLGFPAGECHSVGVGGHVSGGGFGMMARKYGLSADNVIDALIVDVTGRILDRDSMGEDLFWAIRGGGGASFGVILSYKINLVYVPPTVTAFSPSRTILDQGGTHLVHKWQHIGHKLPHDLFISLSISPVQVSSSSDSNNRTMQITFNSLFLGSADELMKTMNNVFPELGLEKADCMEMSWIESVVYFSTYLRGEEIKALIERRPWPRGYFKIKSDYVKNPIPEAALEQLWKWCLEEENLVLVVEPYGGRMSEIQERDTPNPHRAGNLYNIQYVLNWVEEGFEASERNLDRLRRIYEKMTPYVSNNPREIYLNYRDIDLGTNGNNPSYFKAMTWGIKYFMGNYRRLAMIKAKVDPTNFFFHEQSIPPLVLSKSNVEYL